ncbi:MAG: rRNA maturation RNase YbeY [Deltaproteobacteria bacterium]|nr:rRNA maturation RNase YbeY [Deltaproteobacteria bacterium]
MTRYGVSIRQHPRPAPFDGAKLRALVRNALALLEPDAADLRILVVDDAEMTEWNRRFLGRPRTTNVISFPDGDAPGLAGDILISAPTCLRQTSGWPGSSEERVLFFIIHGILHLSGHDHELGATEARRMRSAEMKLYRSALGKVRS